LRLSRWGLMACSKIAEHQDEEHRDDPHQNPMSFRYIKAPIYLRMLGDENTGDPLWEQ
jgi:hypothetical protein